MKAFLNSNPNSVDKTMVHCISPLGNLLLFSSGTKCRWRKLIGPLIGPYVGLFLFCFLWTFDEHFYISVEQHRKKYHFFFFFRKYNFIPKHMTVILLSLIYKYCLNFISMSILFRGPLETFSRVSNRNFTMRCDKLLRGSMTCLWLYWTRADAGLNWRHLTRCPAGFRAW